MNEFDSAFYHIVGRKLRELRTENNFPLEFLANKISSTIKTAQRYEMGERKIDASTLKVMVEALGGVYEDFIRAVQQEQLGTSASTVPLPSGAFAYNPTHRIPLLGQIAAGLPVYAEENLEGYIWTDRNHGAEYFGLRVRGDSMNAANIKDGDILVVRVQDIVEDGDIAIVLVDDDATVKRYHRDGDTIVLSPQSSNPAHHVQLYKLNEHTIRILGRVVESRTEY